MDSSRTQNVSKRSDPVSFPAKSSISSRRSLSSSSSFSSFSSCSSSSLVFPGDSPLNSPATPLHILGVPFSWEQLPGKPKDYSHRLNNNRRNDESSNLLPLPPHRSVSFPATGKNHKSNSSSKKHSFPVTVRDPFAAALLECSKDEGTISDDEEDDVDGGGGEIVDRRFRENSGGSSSKALSKSSIGDRFGLVNLYGSCRRTCAVSESIVNLPRSRKAPSYDHLLLPRRRR
ncbi:PREDICTED: uncharacterized protein LOC104751041 isoform X2 [Camelina sativa]|uniref:Uncharacterized protein LOC104751041 isoform X1 n=1 Tax=Camelina sativa TaxID=90675 RepID=A0ABM0WHN3_CAMSA|nr:PREDICTED: uncharacterized protein LOC104751041 isoform X1 [Camelina sativa]XP_010471218.1 PREDICTED: uncharacterized protein LOC104751041 isoform X3 [Camelina sativa]XP_019093163.1 PREDICTED: uncharacterized protein LOC104751041 isoform X2 [Camelina sativa]